VQKNKQDLTEIEIDRLLSRTYVFKQFNKLDYKKFQTGCDGSSKAQECFA